MNLEEFKDSLNVNTLKRRKLEIGDVIYLRFTREFIDVDKHTINANPGPSRFLLSKSLDTSLLWADDDDDPGEILLNTRQKRAYKKLIKNH